MECDFIYPLKKTETFHLPVFTKLTNSQPQYVLICYIEFLPKSGNRCGNDGHVLAYAPNQSVVSTKSIFTKPMFATEGLCKELMYRLS
jgi:hypothetical protein